MTRKEIEDRKKDHEGGAEIQKRGKRRRGREKEGGRKRERRRAQEKERVIRGQIELGCPT